MNKALQRLSNQTQRLLTAAVLIPLFLLVVLYGSVFQFWLLLCAVILLTLYEFYRLLEIKGIACFTWLGLGLGLILNIAFLTDNPDLLIALGSLSILACLIYALGARVQQSQVLPAMAGTLLGLFYIAWLLNYLLYLRKLPHGRELVILLLFLIWACDSAAYYAGRLWGKHKLAPRISPAKTIEGAIGGLVLSLAVILAARAWFPDLNFIEALLLGLGVGIIAQVGDLCESRIKRWAEVKDSGSLFPGHGGMLDRVDSLILAVPFFYYGVKFMI
jgi:phosphatidate cytidylyltransferase